MEQKNPAYKCEHYCRDAIEQLEVEEALVDDREQLRFGVDFYVVFPNLTNEDFEKAELGRVMDRSHIMFKADVQKPAQFAGLLFQRLTQLDDPIRPIMIDAVRRCLHDEFTVDTPSRERGQIPSPRPDGAVTVVTQIMPDSFVVDIEQESLAKDLGSGPRLLRGVAGTGKTLVMLIRAKLIASNAESQAIPIRILVLCWNISLANYMRQAFQSLRVPLSNASPINIAHFSEFARRLVNAHKEVEKFPVSTAPDFDVSVSERLWQLEIAEEEKYDHVFVDEAQDFRDDWLKFLFEKMTRGNDPRSRNFVVAADDAQRVYRSRNFSWKAMGIPFVGRSTILRKIYRNSARVWAFANLLPGSIKEYYDGDSTVIFITKKGSDPRIVECRSPEDQIAQCVREILDMRNRGLSLRNVLILYNRARSAGGFPIVERLKERLDDCGIAYDWIAESYNAKNNFDWNSETVKISTALSAKGLDAPKVIILSAEEFGGVGALEEHDERKLLYVAMTRAREELLIFYTGAGGVVPDLLGAMSKYSDHRRQILALERPQNT